MQKFITLVADRIKHIKTTILGIAVILFGSILIWYGKIDFTSYLVMVAVSYSLLLCKDDIINKALKIIFKIDEDEPNKKI